MTGQAPDLDDIYRPPEADLLGPSAAPADDEPLRGAGFWIRALARIVDNLVGAGIGMVVGIVLLVLAMVLGYIDDPAQWEERVGSSSLLDYLVGAVGYLLYHSFSEFYGGASVGKLICGLRVIDERRRPPSLRGTIIRGLAFYIDAFFFGLVAHSQMKGTMRQQRYGDIWGRTMVVRSRDAPATARRDGLQLLVGLVGGMLLWGLVLGLPIVVAVFLV